ncbi:LOW QUALITY PROTEIN: uncharacterized protein LOC107411339 [Ziziphus jujuba]|uniref:LOW QUALITY PROTEIN: uncharacterized protein LOC107411339 n=1 Tax=Ziziphus jujuba TaxID=326968 RepID=A0A6P3Z8Z4_ZIZJJ|nr:LOW QUALITY PROTEIN: uncharacterized protein LOC107411339 [Ziziphus jujuba]
MEERKLNFNARLLSVRRFATISVPTEKESGKIIENSPPTTEHVLSPHESYFNMDQVTEPAALVPFHWEQIPGKAKDGKKAGPQRLKEEPSITPRLPPGKVLNAMKQSSGMDSAYQNGTRPRIKAYSFNDELMESKCSKEGPNQRGGLGMEDDNDIYSDALETLSSNESVSLNCSASGLSGYDGTDVKQSGTFSTDSQTRDFMMRRFLPAAKAMVLDSPHYATARRQPMAPEQPREIKKMVNEDKTSVHNEIDSNVVPQFGQHQEEEESEDEVSEYDESPNISAKGCGLFPRLRLSNSLCLLNPVPGMKVRTRAHTPPTHEVARAGRKTNKQSEYKTVNKHALDVAYKQKSDRGFRSAELQAVKSKGTDESRRFAYSGELQKGRSPPFLQPRSAGVSPFRNAACQSPFRGQSDRGIRSGELQVVKNRLVAESSRFAYSGELPKGRISPFRQPRSGGISPFRNEAHESPFRGESDRGVLSAELQAVKSKLSCESSRFTFSGDLQNGRTSPFRQSRSGGISPYRNEARQSPFREVGLLGIPKEGNIKTSSRTNLYSRSSNKFQDVQKNKQGHFRVPAIEKTVYVDTVNNNIAERSYPNSGSIASKGPMDSASEEFEKFLEQRGIEETSTSESLFQEVKCPNIVGRESILEPQVFHSVDDKQSRLSEISHFKAQAVMEASRLGIGREIKSLDLPKLLTANGNADINTGQIVKADVEDINTSFVTSPLPPPLPKSPSESWLWRTLPSVSMKNPISHMNLGLLTKKTESKTSSTNTKWETIVKTSKLNHDHARYSEELIGHISQQSKT